MTKRYVLFFCMMLIAFWGRGQGITADYYRLPDRHQTYNRLLTRYGGAYTIDRWYASLEGFVRTDRAQLDNSLNGLINSDQVTKFGAAAVMGWSYRERWAIEAGYARLPIHTQVSVGNTRSGLSFQYANDRQGLVLRGKRQVLSTSGPWRRSGFWLSAGLWLVPNSGRQEGQFALSGYGYHGRGESPDTLRLISQTRINTRPTTMLEVGAEYNVRLTDYLDLGLTVRKYWGLGNSLSTDLAYTVNHGLPQHAQLTGSGSGMSYGLTLRYTYALRRAQPHVLEVRGRRLGK